MFPMFTSSHRSWMASALALSCVAALAFAQLAPAEAANLHGTLRLPLSYRAWTLESDSAGVKTKIAQMHAPIVGSLALHPTADLVITSAAAGSSLDLGASTGADEISIDGAADVTAQAVWRLLGDRLLLQAGVNLPSGKRELTLDQFALARLLGQPLLGFRLDEYGRGFDWSAGAAAALPAGERVLVGFGGGVVEHGEYVLLAQGGEYRPGREGSVSFGLDLGIDDQGEAPVRLDATYRLYARDELGPTTVFEEGDQLELQLGLHRAGTPNRASLVARLVAKSDNVAHESAVGSDAVASLKTSAGTQLGLSASCERDLSPVATLGFGGAWMNFSDADAPGQEGDAFEFGPALAYSMGRVGRIDLGARYLAATLRPRTVSGAPRPEVSAAGWMASLGFSLFGD